MAQKGFCSQTHAHPNNRICHHLRTPLRTFILESSNRLPTCLYPSMDCEVGEVRNPVCVAHYHRPSACLAQCTIEESCSESVLKERELQWV